MQYRSFGRLDWKPSALGFGTMRLPTIGNDDSRIDEDKAVEMLRFAIDHGVNYVDTAYPYHGGNSEALVGRALQDGYRRKVKIATKLPPWNVNSVEDMDRILGEQLKKLQTDHIDLYLLHSLNRNHWKKFKELDVIDWLEKVMAQGKIGHIGFSFHDDFELFKEIVDYYDKWTFCQIQYNYIDVDFQAGRRGLKYAASRGLGVVIMEPLKGGRLAARPPKQIEAIWNSAKRRRTPVDWALQWLWDQPEVSVVLSGMSTLEQVKQNIESAENSGVNTLTEEERELFRRVSAEYRKLSPVSCTGCSYCMPCPFGVNIPRSFMLYNDAHMYNMPEAAREKYQRIPEENRASACKACGSCEKVCPQNLSIIELLKEVKSYFEQS